MSITTTVRIAAVALAAGAALTGASTASAATAAHGTGLLWVTAAPHETNQLIVEHNGGAFIVTDSSAPMKAGYGCTQVNAHQARCPGLTTDKLQVDAGDLSDAVTLDAGAGAQVTGGAGVDVIRGTPGPDAISGGTEFDVLDGRDGDDRLIGGPGNDRMFGGPGANDQVWYAERTAPVRVDLEGDADDGAPGENDQVMTDVEGILGSHGDDVLRGNALANEIDGLGGNDVILAGDGDDTISGGLRGNDALSGEGGNDTLMGDSNLTVTDSGWGGRDSLSGGPGNDRLFGGPYDDRLDGGLGADWLSGGYGSDSASWSSRGNPLLLALDGLANDGEVGEADNIRDDVEKLLGGFANDTLIGNAFGNTLAGGVGNDYIEPRGGTDYAQGGPGDDRVMVRDGFLDSVDCGDGRDTVVLGQDRDSQQGCEIRDHRG